MFIVTEQKEGLLTKVESNTLEVLLSFGIILGDWWDAQLYRTEGNSGDFVIERYKSCQEIAIIFDRLTIKFSIIGSKLLSLLHERISPFMKNAQYSYTKL